MKKAVLFLNGDYSDEGKPDIEGNTLVIAVDGGLSFLLHNHITPDLFMGSHDNENTQIVAVSSGLEMGIVAGHKRLESIPGEKWSVLPLFGDADGVTLKGFRYEIDNCRMMPSKPYGISNVAKSSPVSISVSQGKVVYFRWKKKPS